LLPDAIHCSGFQFTLGAGRFPVTEINRAVASLAALLVETEIESSIFSLLAKLPDELFPIHELDYRTLLSENQVMPGKPGLTDRRIRAQNVRVMAKSSMGIRTPFPRAHKRISAHLLALFLCLPSMEGRIQAPSGGRSSWR
jgi:hypothetical protein